MTYSWILPQNYSLVIKIRQINQFSGLELVVELCRVKLQKVVEAYSIILS